MAFDESDVAWLEGKVRYEVEKALAAARAETEGRLAALRLPVAAAFARLAHDDLLDWGVVERDLQSVMAVSGEFPPQAMLEVQSLIDLVEMYLGLLSRRGPSAPAGGRPPGL
jgi:hypothetical protein